MKNKHLLNKEFISKRQLKREQANKLKCENRTQVCPNSPD